MDVSRVVGRAIRTSLSIALGAALTATAAAQALEGPASEAPNVVRIRCSDLTIELATALAELAPSPRMAVIGGGSSLAMTALLDGKADVALTMRTLTAVDQAKAKQQGIELESVCLAHRDFAIVVHRDNPIASLTMDDLRRIVATDGDRTRWSQLGAEKGAADEIAVVLPPSNDPSSVCLQAAIGREHKLREGLPKAQPKDLLDRVAANRGAISCVPATAVDATRVRVVPIAGVDSKAPAQLPAVLPGHASYPVCAECWIHWRRGNKGAETFVARATGDPGRAICRREGLTWIERARDASPPKAPAEPKQPGEPKPQSSGR